MGQVWGWGESLSCWIWLSSFNCLFFENMGWAVVPVSLELVKYSLAWSQTIPYGTCDLEAGSIEGLA